MNLLKKMEKNLTKFRISKVLRKSPLKNMKRKIKVLAFSCLAPLIHPPNNNMEHYTCNLPVLCMVSDQLDMSVP